MEIEKMLEVIIVALACPICIPLILEDDKQKAKENPRISIQPQGGCEERGTERRSGEETE